MRWATGTAMAGLARMPYSGFAGLYAGYVSESLEKRCNGLQMGLLGIVVGNAGGSGRVSVYSLLAGYC
jgi:hypothetical protein